MERGVKAKINRQDYIKLKGFCTARETASTIKRQTTEWEIFANNASDKELMSKKYKKLIQLYTKQSN